jgi:hypothetical protein
MTCVVAGFGAGAGTPAPAGRRLRARWSVRGEAADETIMVMIDVLSRPDRYATPPVRERWQRAALLSV